MSQYDMYRLTRPWKPKSSAQNANETINEILSRLETTKEKLLQIVVMIDGGFMRTLAAAHHR